MNRVVFLRVAIILAGGILISSLYRNSDDLWLMGFVSIPLGIAVGLTFSSSFNRKMHRLLAFLLPTLIIYPIGFGPWITDYDSVATSSSTAALDFIIIPFWVTLYGIGLVFLTELGISIIEWLRGKGKKQP